MYLNKKIMVYNTWFEILYNGYKPFIKVICIGWSYLYRKTFKIFF
jgi:hypothetical protein